MTDTGGNNRELILRAGTREFAATPGVLRPDLSVAISQAFTAPGIEIPDLQRDLQLRIGVISIKTTVDS